MSSFKKHVGRIANTDRRCVVVYMQIPGSEDNALVIDTDALPDRFHDALMHVVDSNEAQQTNDLHTLLSRRVMPDTNVDMMNALHQFGLFRPVAINDVIMYPQPNAPCPLRTIVDFVNNEKAGIKSTTENVNLENRHLENQKTTNLEQAQEMAQNILAQALDLENEANKKREQAYKLAPHLRPSPDVTGALANAPIAPNGYVEEMQMADAPVPSADVIDMTPVEAPQTPVQDVTESEALPVMNITADLPEDVLEALRATQQEMASVAVAEHEDVEGNQVDASDDAIQAFLDRAALREDMANKEAWEAMQPKNPVGRPRKDGQPAGTKAEVAPPAPKKRGRPPKAKK